MTAVLSLRCESLINKVGNKRLAVIILPLPEQREVHEDVSRQIT